MSNRPVEELLEHAGESERWSEAIEAHLDAHPFEVDEAEVEASVLRLEQRLGVRRARPRWVFPMGLAVVAALAAALLLTTRGVDERRGIQRTVEPAHLRAIALAPPRRTVIAEVGRAEIGFVEVGRTVQVAPGSEVLSSESGSAAVLLVQKGEVKAGDSSIPEGHWGLLTRLEDGVDVEVVFRDGNAPPTLDPDVWGGTQVQPQLERLRWESLPDRTTQTLNRLLEDR